MPLLAGLGPLGVPELLIIAFVVILIFGVGRLPEVGGALGKGIREFRKSTKDDDEKPSDTVAQSSAQPHGDAGASADTVFCGECGSRNSRAAKFCNSCGKPLEIPSA
ncbi:MAG: twin-arginine translocase TatA/TatE family subunit [Dehalococcoidia bacterium]|nr:MAG: twin-arginine translocase TatA/TatE family subunit [Dehalococcoidia bacterium]